LESNERKAGSLMEILPWLVLAVLWVLASVGSGFLLALLARRLHPSLNLVRLWFFYTILMAVLVAIVLLIIGF
jgi:hypothetical protein